MAVCCANIHMSCRAADLREQKDGTWQMTSFWMGIPINPATIAVAKLKLGVGVRVLQHFEIIGAYVHRTRESTRQRGPDTYLSLSVAAILVGRRCFKAQQTLDLG
jgi:hypothetical protein